jgi:NAD+ diphosphatase
MELIRELHDSFNEDSQLIIFCDNKILYDQAQNNYCFAINDLNTINHDSPYLCIAKNQEKQIYILDVAQGDQILGLFMDPKDISFIDLRQLLGLISSENFQLLSRASILRTWKRNTQFCSLCGNKNIFNEKESAYDCNCNKIPKYPSISPCIITLIYNEDKILLGRSNFFPPNMFSTLAGFIEAGENAEQALIREVKEEVNVEVSDIHYHSSQSWPFPSQLMLGYTCKYVSGNIVLNDLELEEARWFDIGDLPIIPPVSSISGQLIRSYIEDRSKL